MMIDRRGLVLGSGVVALDALSGWHPAWTQTAPTSKFVPTPSERVAMADAATKFMGSYEVPGLGVAIVRHGELVYDEAFGLADKEAGERLTTAHRFRIASVSKPITSVAIFFPDRAERVDPERSGVRARWHSRERFRTIARKQSN